MGLRVFFIRKRKKGAHRIYTLFFLHFFFRKKVQRMRIFSFGPQSGALPFFLRPAERIFFHFFFRKKGAAKQSALHINVRKCVKARKSGEKKMRTALQVFEVFFEKSILIFLKKNFFLFFYDIILFIIRFFPLFFFPAKRIVSQSGGKKSALHHFFAPFFFSTKKKLTHFFS